MKYLIVHTQTASVILKFLKRNQSDETNKDPIDAHRKKIKDRKRNELVLAKLLGDTKSLEEEIDEYIR